VAQPRTVQLRVSRTAFADQLAGVLEQPVTESVQLSVLSPEQAVPPMRRILARLGLETAQAIRQSDGSRRPTWYEDPALWVSRWVNSESVIVLKEDAQGPIAIQFNQRLAADTVQVVYRIGDAPGHAALLRAYWDLGIRRSVWEFHQAATPPGYVARVQARYAAIEGCVLAITPRGDGWMDYVLTLRTRPGERRTAIN
jgi:hypothetical protein